MVYSTATGSLYNDVHPGDTSLNMTPWTTATLILACPLALRYADDVARFTCWNQLALPIFCLNNPFPTHVLFWTFPNKNTLCVLGEEAAMPTCKNRSLRSLYLRSLRAPCFAWGYSSTVAVKELRVGKARLCWKFNWKPSFCYTPRGWFHLPHFYHSTVQRHQRHVVAVPLNGTSHWWQSGPWHNPCLAHLYWPPISLHWKKHLYYQLVSEDRKLQLTCIYQRK